MAECETGYEIRMALSTGSMLDASLEGVALVLEEEEGVFVNFMVKDSRL